MTSKLFQGFSQIRLRVDVLCRVSNNGREIYAVISDLVDLISCVMCILSQYRTVNILCNL